MKETKEAKISYFTAHLPTIISVSLVLIIVGVIAMISISASNATKQIKQQIEISLIMADNVENEQAMPLLTELQSKRYVNSSNFISKEDALADWEKQTGDNLMEIAGCNPLSPEISLTLKADFTHPDSIAVIKSELASFEEVAEVVVPDSEMVNKMNSTIEWWSIIMGVIALALIIISFVLINNTVHLTIYAKRFTIHTMQLVGATNGFIRRPFIKNNLLAGLISSAVACVLLSGVVFYVSDSGIPDFSDYLNWESVLIIFVALFLLSSLICGIAAWMATNKYLRKKYDELFR